jgi:3-oxoacyl-[acyl-carrier-protein] synthase-3
MSLVKCKFKIEASGIYLPPKKVTAEEIAKKANVSTEWLLKSAGVETRYFAENETIASMAAKAIKNAIEKTHLKYEDIDLLIAAGGTPDQPIPHNSALIHNELKLPKNVTPFDINGTCLSFGHAIQVAASLLQNRIHKNIIIVSSEKPSIGLNYNWPESAALFGDGAVAFILSETDEECGWMFSEYETYSEAVHLAEIPAGGTRVHPKEISDSGSEQFLFKMEGQQIYKTASFYLPEFYSNTLKKNHFTIDSFKMVVPHQASVLALNLMRNKLNIPAEKFHINVHKYGNLVAASIPMSLHELLENKTLVKGDKALLMSTAAGLTLGSMGLQF